MKRCMIIFGVACVMLIPVGCERDEPMEDAAIYDPQLDSLSRPMEGILDENLIGDQAAISRAVPKRVVKLPEVSPSVPPVEEPEPAGLPSPPPLPAGLDQSAQPGGSTEDATAAKPSVGGLLKRGLGRIIAPTQP